jgi:hypothetical protein
VGYNAAKNAKALALGVVGPLAPMIAAAAVKPMIAAAAIKNRSVAKRKAR